MPNRNATLRAWQASTVYVADDVVLSPDGYIVKAKVSFTSGLLFVPADWNYVSSGSSNQLGTPSNPVTSASAARPTGLTVVYWRTTTQPTNWVAGDVWTQA